MKRITRREFGALVAGGVVAGVTAGRFANGEEAVAAAPRAAQEPVTADRIVARIRSGIGVEWNPESIDTFKAGDPAAVVTGVVTTSLATMEVLREAVAARANLIITSGTTFYSRADSRTAPAGRSGGAGPAAGAAGDGAAQTPAAPPPNPIFEAKNRFIDENGLIVFRLSDHWRARTPDGFALGLAERIFGEGAFAAPDGPIFFDIPATPLEVVARDVKTRLGGRGGIRVIGDPGVRIRKVAFLPGTTPITASLAALPQADLVIAGEVREWESAEYARDSVFAGRQKGFMTIGRVLSEDPGMALCARWLSDLVPEVGVRHVSAGDPYWRPVA